MKRREFLRDIGLLTGAAALAPSGLWSMPGVRAADLILRGAIVYDGMGTAPVEVDIAITGGRISAVGPGLSSAGAHEVDLRGLALAPGFIDIHSHTDLVLLVDPRAPSKLRQGVTTEVAGADGGSVGLWSDAEYEAIRERYRREYDVEIDFRDLAGFFRRIDQQGAALNFASMIGAGTVRSYVMGNDDRPPTPAELEQMVALTRAAINAGACGVSSGLEYTPGGFADLDELVALASVLQGTGLPYASHMRNEDDRLFAAIEETINVGVGARVPVQISHLKAQGQRNWWKGAPVLEMIDQARAAGLDVGFDVYPYIAYSTGLSNLFPIWARDGGNQAFVARLEDPALRPRLETAVRDKIDNLGSWDAVQVSTTGEERFAYARGRRLGELAREEGRDPYELLVDILTDGGGGMVGFGMKEENIELFLKHPSSIICSDGGARAIEGPLSSGTPHPRNFGAFPRVLGHYCRERQVLPLEVAIQKMTSLPAERAGIRDRGRIRPGAVADLVIFDPDTVADRATFENPHQYPVGIPHVMVNGEFVLRDGEEMEALPGRSVRVGGAA